MGGRGEGKNSAFNKWCWDNWIIPLQKNKFWPNLIPYTKIKDLKVRARTIQLLEENTVVNPPDFRYWEDS